MVRPEPVMQEEQEPVITDTVPSEERLAVLQETYHRIEPLMPRVKALDNRYCPVCFRRVSVRRKPALAVSYHTAQDPALNVSRSKIKAGSSKEMACIGHVQEMQGITLAEITSKAFNISEANSTERQEYMEFLAEIKRKSEQFLHDHAMDEESVSHDELVRLLAAIQLDEKGNLLELTDDVARLRIVELEEQLEEARQTSEDKATADAADAIAASMSESEKFVREFVQKEEVPEGDIHLPQGERIEVRSGETSFEDAMDAGYRALATHMSQDAAEELPALRSRLEKALNHIEALEESIPRMILAAVQR